MTTLIMEKQEVSQQIMDQAVDFGEAFQEAVASVGDKFGLYDVMLNHGPITSACLATQAGIPERFVRLWLNVQAAGNSLGHHAPTDFYGLWCAWPANSDKVF